MNPIIAGLSIVLVSVLSVGATLLRSRRPPPPPDPPLDDEAPAPPQQPRAEPGSRAWPRPAPAPAPCEPLPGHGCVAGRIEFAREVAEHPAFEELALVATRIRLRHEDEDEDEDGDGDVDGQVRVDGAFEVQVGPGDWDLVVTAEGDEDGDGDGSLDVTLIGGVDGLHVEAGAALDAVVITMAPAVRIRGHLRGMMGIAVGGATVRARRAGRGAVLAKIESDDDGGFGFAGLRPGDYDLSVDESPHHRARRVPVVRAPVDGLTIDLARRPVLTGALRAGADGTCPARTLRLERGDDWESELTLDGDCRFVSEPLPGAGEVRIEGMVHGRSLSLPISVPASGDPLPLCLGGACPPDMAVLAIGIDDGIGNSDSDSDSDSDSTVYEATELGYETLDPDPADDEGQASGGGQIGSGIEPAAVTYVGGLPVGRPVRVWAQRGDQRGEAIVVPGAGVHEMVLRLVRR